MNSSSPIICFGQQLSGFFPKRFFVAKILTARRLQAEIGGEIVYFCHDSDHDPRETRTPLAHRKNGELFEFNFAFDNKLQRKFSPQYLKRVRDDWKAKTALQLPAYASPPIVQAFRENSATNQADFCLHMYKELGLLEGVRIARSSDPQFRREACPVDDYFADVPFEDEIVRARVLPDGTLQLHEGGDSHRIITAPQPITAEQISPTRDTRLKWMQSVLHCTHYIAGASEQNYMRRADAPEITYVARDAIERPHESWCELVS